MASGSITSWQIEGEKMEAVTDVLFLSSKIFAYGDCSHDIRRLLLLRRKATTNLDSLLKSKGITLPTKLPIIKLWLIQQSCMYRYESWTIKKSECGRIDAFDLWCQRRLLRVLWTRRSYWSILKEINPEYSLEELMLKLKLQYFGHLM